MVSVIAMPTKGSIITVPDSIMAKSRMAGMGLEELSLETVKMFHDDGVASGMKIL